MFRKTESERFLESKRKEYSKEGREILDDVPRLVVYLASRDDTSPYFFDYFDTKAEISGYLDRKLMELTNKPKYQRVFDEVTGDADFITSEKRYEMYRSLIEDFDVRMRILMRVDWDTKENAQRLIDAGVELRHLNSNLHFGLIDRDLMFSLNRTPKNSDVKKVSGEPQKAKDMIYSFVSTNNKSFVRYARDLFEELNRASTPHNIQDEIEMSTRIRETSSLLNLIA